ncbi:carboxylesterase family protein [Fluviicola sp.]|uniref:carboxylesterase family protein n=1 Tax=Fluviicola sp. TaxID=1917219 RepID=UPI003D26BDD3
MMKLIVSILSFVTIISVKGQTITTQFGLIQGSMNGSVYQFLGIPFAKPPVGNLRWKAPENPTAWASVLNTTSFAPVCPQKSFDQGGTNGTVIGNEDCLYLNVWSPEVNTANLPVLVFIHGGGNQQGSASEVNGGTEMFFGKNMAERGNAVVVTIQYRLGPLGFLAHAGLEPENVQGTSGNYAVMDQLLALNWVKNNISQFGGDTTKVMIFGESAGGINVGNLLTTPLGNGLFQRAVIQSAVPMISDYSTARNNGAAYVDSFTVVGTDVQKIAYMRSLPSDSLVKDEEPPISGGAVGLIWQAVVDNHVFFDLPMNSFQSGNFNHVPLIIGSNSEEMSLSAPATVFPLMVSALISGYVPTPLQAQATALYPPGSNTTEARVSYINLLTDAQFTATTRRVAACVSMNQSEPVFRYFFTHKHSVAALSSFGSYHGMELFYVFNNWENATLGSGPLFSPQDDSVQNAMLQYWVNFANTGNPNGAGLATWSGYQSATDCYLEIKATPNGTQCGLRTAESDLWDEAINYTPCTSSLGIESLSKDFSFSIFPNPTSGKTQWNIPLEWNYFEVRIFNPLGNLIFKGENSSVVDLTDQSEGIYFITIESENQQFSGKIIKNM